MLQGDLHDSKRQVSNLDHGLLRSREAWVAVLSTEYSPSRSWPGLEEAVGVPKSKNQNTLLVRDTGWENTIS